MQSDIVQRLEALIERQRDARGDMLYKGSADPELVDARAEITRLTEALCFIGKWVERGVFDAQISADEALEVIINLPGMPWNSARWDVDHKPYAAAYYARFPAALKGPSHD